jgi:hypothetical protein
VIIITLKNNSHLEWRVGLSDTILKGTHPGTIYAMFGRESISLTFPIDISYLIHSVGIKWNVGGCKLEKKLEAQH